jgi:hypothetical protein
MILPDLHPDDGFREVVLAFMDEYGMTRAEAKAYLTGAIAAGEFSWSELLDGKYSPNWVQA